MFTPTRRYFVPFLFVLLLVPIVLHAAIPSTQRQALVAIYNSTGGDAWTINAGWKTPPLDSDGFAMPGTEGGWYGVTTGASNSTVTAINLSSNNLVGNLSSAVGDLMGLTALNLHTNQLTGSLPPSLGNLTNLNILHLYDNGFTGSLPVELGNLMNLQMLHLYDNQLAGSLPASLGNLASLQSLLLNANQFTGSLPPELGNLTSLQMLNCHNNQLTGPIPTTFGGMTSLVLLLLHGNALSGSIPAELGNLSNLRFFFLNENQMTGPIPASIGNLASLEDLDFGHNQLSGSIPAEIGNLTNLLDLHLNFNQLSGPIPSALGGLTACLSITLQFNQLSGALPAELGDLTSLQVLDLHSNQLSGSIPPELGNLSSLDTLYLNNNQLTGTIPAALGNLSHLLYLRLDENHLSGTTPAELGNITNLVYLFLGDNQLSGTIPASIGNLISLEYLYLRSNRLAGPVPTSITSLTALNTTATDLGYNALYTADPAVAAFLTSKDADWSTTQTIAPSGMTAASLDGASILVSWLPIAYTGDGGYYALYSSQTAGGPYAYVGQTANKNTAFLQASGLAPGQRYYFVVRTHTDVHSGNQNAIDSDDSQEVSAIAWWQVNVRIAGAVTLGGSPLAGVVMSGLTGSPVTDANGFYSGTEAVNWSGTVTPMLVGYTFVPGSLTYTGITTDQVNQSFVATAITPTITVTSPNGGESWTVGSAHAITWTQTNMTGSVTIDLYKASVFQSTLGTVAATAGTYTWTIASNLAAGTDYRILVWQSGVSDESNANFSLTRKIKVDFNRDGQEDILWRYHGGGEYQGLNVIWLLSQSGTVPLLPLNASSMNFGATSILTTSTASNMNTPAPQASAVRTALTERTFRTIMDGGKASRSELTRVLNAPADKRTSAIRGNIGPRQLKNIPTRTDAIGMRAAAGSGQATTAAVSLTQELVFSQVQDTAWEIAGTGDFNGDSNTDILWRYYGTGDYQGLNVIWYMNGTTFQSENVFSSVPDTNWRIVGTGDFNGDGQTDILWRYYGTGDYQGLNDIWYMNGSEFVSENVFSVVTDTQWQIAGTGDFNGDGQTDILWRYYGTGDYQGLNDIWYMNGSTFQSENVFSVVLDTAWQIVGTGDFDADGQTDILWRYYGTGDYQGLNDIWYMNGARFVSEEVFSAVRDTNWRIVNR